MGKKTKAGGRKSKQASGNPKNRKPGKSMGPAKSWISDEEKKLIKTILRIASLRKRPEKKRVVKKAKPRRAARKPAKKVVKRLRPVVKKRVVKPGKGVAPKKRGIAKKPRKVKRAVKREKPSERVKPKRVVLEPKTIVPPKASEVSTPRRKKAEVKGELIDKLEKGMEGRKRAHKEIRKKVLEKHRERVKEVKAQPKAEVQKKTGFVYKNVDGRAVILETDVDRLLGIITKKEKLKASKLARIFKVPKSKIEEWGIILEDHKLIDMHYPPFGEPTLMVKKPEKKKKHKGKK